MTKPDDIPSLNQLGQEIREFRGKTAQTSKQTPQSGPALGIRIGTEFMSVVFVGGVLGYYLDNWLSTSPFLFMLGMFLGFAGGVMTAMRTLKIAQIGEDKGNTGSG